MLTRLPNKKHSQRGALMAAALMFMLMSGIFIGAWVSLMSTRAAQASYLETAVQRRISVENSRQLAWQCALENAFNPNSDLAGNQASVFTANAGGISTDNGWTNLNIYTSTETVGAMTTVFPYNYTGLRPVVSYLTRDSLTRPTALSGAVDPFHAYLFLKSYNPVLAGDLFVTYRRPDTSPSALDVYAATSSHNANWTIEGRAVIRSPDSLFSLSTTSPLQLPFRTRSLYIQAHDSYNSRSILGTNLSGQRLAPSNMPAQPTTTGPVSGTASQTFEGYLNVIRNDSNTDNSLWHFMEREQANGTGSFDTIDVFAASAAGGPYWMEEQASPTYPPPNWPSGYPPKLRVLVVQLDDAALPHLRIHGVVDQIIFRGQSSAAAFTAAGALAPVMIAMVPMNSTGPSVRDLRFQGDNNRRIVLGVQHWNAATLDISWAGNPLSGSEYLWRTVLINEFQTVMLNMPATVSRSVRWIGGVMTNWTFKRRSAGGTNASRLVFASDSSVATATPAGPAFASLLPRDAWLESYFLLDQ